MIKYRIASWVLIIFILTAHFSCSNQKKRVINFPATDLSQSPLIPKPLSITPAFGGFALDEFTIIQTSPDEESFVKLGKLLAAKINDKTGLNPAVNADNPINLQSVIFLHKSDEIDSENPEAYRIKISSDSLILAAKTDEGAFRGIQTIRQIIPELSNDTIAETSVWVIPTGTITDEPQFAYRGAMLDVARHFFSVQDVRKFMDILAYYKYNVLHLHLSDDQGWRIEIKSWPKLTEIGGSTEVGGDSGGFFTQEDYKELVDFAASNYMMIVPEIDMPGHTNAASVSYPILNGNGKTPELYTGTEVGFSTFDTRKDTVYAFIDDVVREIAAISPGPYFHIGGDESHVTEKDDYIYFVNRVEKIVQKYGKLMIGWDEIATADMDSTSIAQFWASNENAKLASQKGMKIIMSPAKKAYLDMQYDTASIYGLHWAAYIPTDTAYNWSPETYAGIPLSNILGLEAPLWSETISNIEELEYLAFPRAIGYAELGWTTKENRSWESFKTRLSYQTPYLNRMNVKYYASPLIEWKDKDAYRKIEND